MKSILRIILRSGGWRDQFKLHIRNPPFGTLVIEAMTNPGPCGLPAISVRQHGGTDENHCADLEMFFELGLSGGVHMNPFYYRNDSDAVESFSRKTDIEYYRYDPVLHRKHEQIARIWDHSLRIEGYVAAFQHRIKGPH